MKNYPRLLNRLLLFLLGLGLLGSGIGLLLVSYWPPARNTFLTQIEQLHTSYQELWENSLVAIPGRAVLPFSWLDLAWLSGAWLLALGFILWIVQQGGGRVKEINLFKQNGKPQKRRHQPAQANPKQPDQQPGEIIAQVGLIDDLIQDALLEDRWIDQVKTTIWQVRKEPGISLSIVAFKGADLAHLKAVTDQAIARIDSVLGNPVPINVHITTNWRANFKSAERTDR